MTSSEETDRVVSRRVDNPTAAEPGDERVHRAAQNDPQDAAVDPSPDDDSEPTRSE